MSRVRLYQLWHLALAVAPFVAIALTLAAGRRWC
jgi:hypothetical protein